MRKALISIGATGAVTVGLLLAGGTAASANTDPNFQPGHDYTNFQPGPDYGPFQPGYAPGTADLIDDTVGGLLGGLFR